MANQSISVIVPTYNHENFIADALQGIVQQDIFDSVKVFVSDDASSDQTFKIASEYSDRYPNIYTFRNLSNLGLLKNYEELVKRCDTEYLAIIEGDDLWIAPDKLRKQLQFLQENKQVNGCFSEFYLLDETSGVFPKRPHWANGKYRILNLLDILYGNPSATFSTCCYRTSAFSKALANLKGSNVADWATNMLVAESGGFGFVPGAAVVYRVHENGLWNGLAPARQNEVAMESVEKVFALLPDRYSSFFQDFLNNRMMPA